jgi:hypothetical protein
VIAHGGIRTVRPYVIAISGIDDLVAEVFKICSWNPGVFMGHSPAALEAIKRENDHWEFLTTVFGVPGAPEWPVGR